MGKFIAFIFAILWVQFAEAQVTVPASVFSSCDNVTAFDKNSIPDLGLIIYSDDEETVWNALRLAIFSQGKGDTVVVFVLGKAVDTFMKEQAETEIFNIQIISDAFLRNGGNIYLCASCAKIRNTDEIQSCTITSMEDLYNIVQKSKKVLTF